jgi:hypothetical protein
MLPHLSVHLTAHADDRVLPLLLMARTIPSPLPKRKGDRRVIKVLFIRFLLAC